MRKSALNLERAFGRVVQARRKKLRLSQEETAFRSGLHRTFVSQIERGLKSPSLRTIVALGRVLEVDAHVLVREAIEIAKETR